MKKLIICLLSLLLFACEPVTQYEPDVRPPSLPETAFWVGSADGGAYIDIIYKNNKYIGSVYFDSTGELWYEGEFVYSGEELFDVKNHKFYSAWDGDTIYLVNGETLHTVSK